MSWDRIVRAAGLYSPKQDALTVFQLAGAIIGDEVVSARVCALENPDGSAVAPDGAQEIVLRAMSDEERAALKERIRAHFSGKAAVTHG